MTDPKGGDSILWRRLDTPGHDACRLTQIATGWRLDGAAVFRHDDQAARLAYRVTCDTKWHSRDGRITGWVGERAIDVTVLHFADGRWLLNGRAVAGLDGCVDLDFGFTPATNLFQLRRVNLAVGEGADVPVAWLDVPDTTLSVLNQRYERRAEHEYWYEAPQFEYSALLEIDETGFACRYPPLWEMER